MVPGGGGKTTLASHNLLLDLEPIRAISDIQTYCSFINKYSTQFNVVNEPVGTLWTCIMADVLRRVKKTDPHPYATLVMATWSTQLPNWLPKAESLLCIPEEWVHEANLRSKFGYVYNREAQHSYNWFRKYAREASSSVTRYRYYSNSQLAGKVTSYMSSNAATEQHRYASLNTHYEADLRSTLDTSREAILAKLMIEKLAYDNIWLTGYYHTTASADLPPQHTRRECRAVLTRSSVTLFMRRLHRIYPGILLDVDGFLALGARDQALTAVCVLTLALTGATVSAESWALAEVPTSLKCVQIVDLNNALTRIVKVDFQYRYVYSVANRASWLQTMACSNMSRASVSVTVVDDAPSSIYLTD